MTTLYAPSLRRFVVLPIPHPSSEDCSRRSAGVYRLPMPQGGRQRLNDWTNWPVLKLWDWRSRSVLLCWDCRGTCVGIVGKGGLRVVGWEKAAPWPAEWAKRLPRMGSEYVTDPMLDTAHGYWSLAGESKSVTIGEGQRHEGKG